MSALARPLIRPSTGLTTGAGSSAVIQRAPDGRSAPRPAAVPTPAPMPSVAPAGVSVSQPGDAGEREAARVANQVVNMPAAPLSATGARFAGAVPSARSSGAAATSSNAISASGGQPLPISVRRFMEPRFNADFASVRIHTDEAAATRSRELNAAAFTMGHQIFFARGAYQPDSSEGRELIAHELAHTIQQGAAPQQAASPSSPSSSPATGIQRSLAPRVSERPGAGIQRLGLSDAIAYFAEQAQFIPGFRLLTMVLGFNPISGQGVDRNAGNLLRAVIELLPGGALITQALDNHGIVERVANWALQQLAALAGIGQRIRQAVRAFVDGLSWRDIFSLGGLWERASRLVSEPVTQVLGFVRGLVGGIIALIKDAILRPIARLAQGTRGYDLLCAVLGFDPVTGDAVPRTAATLVGGFMKLIGREDIWENIQKGNAVGRAYAWFQGAVAGLMAFVQRIPQLFVQAFTSLELADIVLLPRAFLRIAGVFGGFIGQFIAWAREATWQLLEIIFAVVAPGVLVYLQRARGALRTIVNNPVSFIANLVRAGVTGLRQFAARFMAHMRAALIGWLAGALAGSGVYAPQALSFIEILKFVTSLLGVTWQHIRAKLVKATSETAVRAMEMGVDIVLALVTGGPAAAWGQLMETLGNLREMVMEQLISFVSRNIVEAAILKLVSMLNPAGAFIQAIIAIYNTILFFVERMKQIAQVAVAVMDSIAAIAAGAIGAAANKVESTLAGLLTLAISFLARLMGLGRLGDAIREVVERVRAPIDAALDRVVQWIVGMAGRVGSAVKGLAQRVLNWMGIRKPFKVGDEAHSLYFEGEGAQRRVMMASTPSQYKQTIQAMELKDKDDKKAKAKALLILDKLDQAMLDAGKPGVPGETAAASIDGLMSELAVQTAKFMSPQQLAARANKPIYANAKGFGISATAECLTTARGEDPPSVSDTEVWHLLELRKHGAYPYYVKGHLLNGKLWGSGSDWRNLAPLTQPTNNLSPFSMLRQFESQVVKAAGEGTRVTVTVSMLYGRSAPTLSKKQELDITEDVATVKAIMKAETLVPRAVRCEAYKLDAAGTRSNLTGVVQVENHIDQTPANYFLSAGDMRPLHVNRATKPQMVAMGVPEVLADRLLSLKGNKPYKSKHDVAERLTVDEAHQLASLARVSLRFDA